MPESLITHLRALEPDDLQTLLQRRAETRLRLARRGHPDFAALAEALAQSNGIRAAAASLDLFLSQLLQVARWLGPQVTPEALAEQAEGVPADDLRRGAEELSRWGLAFIKPDRREEGQGWLLEVPACTSAAVTMPRGFGTPARGLLAHRSVPFLATLARHLGLPARPHSGKDTMIAELAAALSEPTVVTGLLDAAPEKAFHLFATLLEAGGGMSRHELMVAGHVRWSDPPWTERREVLTPLDHLESRGLVMLDSTGSYSGEVTVPSEVQLALTGGRLFDSWPPATPPPVALPEDEAPTSLGHGDPSKILVDMEALLEAWAQSRPVSLQRGGLGIRELRKAAKALGFPERYVSFLYALAIESGLAGSDADGRILPSPSAAQWRDQPPAQRWALLFWTWLGSRVWSEQDNGLVRLDQLPRQNSAARHRTSVLEELASLPVGTYTNAKLLGAGLAWRHPRAIHCEECAANLVEKVVEALAWLGTAAGAAPAGPIALVEPGRSAVVDRDWATKDGPALSTFAPEVATCTVGADLNVIVPGPPVRELGSALSRFADLKASSPARIYLLSEASIRRGLDSGMQAEEIVSVLERHAPRGVPQNVTYLIEDVGRRHGHLVAGRLGLYLRSDDAALLGSAMADRRLASFHPRLVAPTVAVLKGKDVDELLGALRGAGYLPVAEAADGSRRASEAADDVRPLLHAEPPETLVTRTEAAELAEAIRRGERTPQAKAAPVRELVRMETRRPAEDHHLESDIRRLLAQAVEESMVVEISYRDSEGQYTTRSIEPLEVIGGMVDAWCRLRQDERRFALSGIDWARATGERFNDVGSLDEEVEFRDHR